jgi:hypothetical protein
MIVMPERNFLATIIAIEKNNALRFPEMPKTPIGVLLMSRTSLGFMLLGKKKIGARDKTVGSGSTIMKSGFW